MARKSTSLAEAQKPKGSASVLVENQHTAFVSFNVRGNYMRRVVLPPAVFHPITRSVYPTQTLVDRDLWEAAKKSCKALQVELDSGTFIREIHSTA